MYIPDSVRLSDLRAQRDALDKHISFLENIPKDRCDPGTVAVLSITKEGQERKRLAYKYPGQTGWIISTATEQVAWQQLFTGGVIGAHVSKIETYIQDGKIYDASENRA